MNATKTIPIAIAIVALSCFASSAHAAVHQNATVNPQNLNTGLVGHWTFDGANMIKNVADTSGQGNNGFLTNFTSTSTAEVPGAIGQALNFNGSNQYVSVPDNAALAPASITISVWIKLTSAPGGVLSIIDKRDDNGGTAGYNLELNGNVTLFQAHSAMSASFNLSNNINKWAHLVYTQSGTTGTLYINGIAVQSSGTMTAVANFSTPLLIGARKGGTNDFPGAIDDTRIYSRTLSAAEIKQLYNLGSASHQNATVNPQNLNTGLVGHWTFDGADMIQNVADVSGSGYNGSLLGVTSTSTAEVPGVIGQALNFKDSTSNYVNVGSVPLNLGSSFSIGSWIKAKSDRSGFHQIISKGPKAAGHFEFYVNATTGDLCAYVPDLTSPNVCALTASGVDDGAWHYVALTYTGATLTFYIDGKVQRSVADTGTIANATASVYIGAQVDAGPTMPFDGALDDLRVYSRALSAVEIKQLYNLGSATHQNATVNPPNLNTGLVGHWTFDGANMISTVADVSGQGNNGSLSGFTSTSTAEVPGVIGQALNIGANGQNIVLPDGAAIGSGNWTISAWMKQSASRNSVSVIYGQSANIFFVQSGTPYHMGFQTDGSLGFQTITGTGAISAGVWYHVAVVHGGTAAGQTSLYVNGVRGDNAVAIGSLQIPTFVRMGMQVGNSARTFLGSLDDVRVYTRALSAAEIKQLYNLGR